MNVVTDGLLFSIVLVGIANWQATGGTDGAVPAVLGVIVALAAIAVGAFKTAARATEG